MKNWLIILAILIIPIGIYAYLNNSNAPFESAHATAGKPVVYKFQSTMCSDCKKIDNELKTIIPEYQNKITFEQIEVQKGDTYTNKMIKKHKVSVVPTLIFIDSSGHEVKRTEGYQTKETLENILKALQ